MLLSKILIEKTIIEVFLWSNMAQSWVSVSAGCSKCPGPLLEPISPGGFQEAQPVPSCAFRCLNVLANLSLVVCAGKAHLASQTGLCGNFSTSSHESTSESQSIHSRLLLEALKALKWPLWAVHFLTEVPRLSQTYPIPEGQRRAGIQRPG